MEKRILCTKLDRFRANSCIFSESYQNVKFFFSTSGLELDPVDRIIFHRIL